MNHLPKHLAKKEKNLQKQIEKLEKENQSLRKQINRLRKEIDRSEEYLLDSYSVSEVEDITEEKKERVVNCESCGGPVRKFKIMDRVFHVCQRCKGRRKVE